MKKSNIYKLLFNIIILLFIVVISVYTNDLFARAGGGVTGGLENLRHGHGGFRQRKLARAER